MTQAAIGAGDDILFANQFGETDDAFGDQFGMFDEVGEVVDHAGEKDLALRQFVFLPNLPFMAVTRVGGLEGDALDVGFEDDFDDVAERDVAVVRPLVVAPADMDAHLLGRDRLEA